MNCSEKMCVESTPPINVIMKIILIGDYRTGKSCCLDVFVKERFNPDSKEMIGATFKWNRFRPGPHCREFRVWDPSRN
jgi:GTPase SAR1 family protein